MRFHTFARVAGRGIALTAMALLMALLMASAPVAATETASASTSETDWYPKPLGEIKGVLATLALPAGQGSVQDRYLQRLKMYRYICDLPYEDLVWSTELEEYAQQAVVAFALNNEASHGPKKPPQMSDEDYRKAQRGAGGVGDGGAEHSLLQPVAAHAAFQPR